VLAHGPRQPSSLLKLGVRRGAAEIVKMRHFRAVTVLTLWLAAGSAWAQAHEPRFAVYRINWPPARLLALSGTDTSDDSLSVATVTQERLLAAAARHEPPILTEADIIDYCWRTQTISVTDEGAVRWNSTGGWSTPLTGQALLVVVDGEARYGAMLWNPASSLSCELPQFWCKIVDSRLVVGGRRIGAAGDTVFAACYDAKAKAVLRDLGKLQDSCGED